MAVVRTAEFYEDKSWKKKKPAETWNKTRGWRQMASLAQSKGDKIHLPTSIKLTDYYEKCLLFSLSKNWSVK